MYQGILTHFNNKSTNITKLVRAEINFIKKQNKSQMTKIWKHYYTMNDKLHLLIESKDNSNVEAVEGRHSNVDKNNKRQTTIEEAFAKRAKSVVDTVRDSPGQSFNFVSSTI